MKMRYFAMASLFVCLLGTMAFGQITYTQRDTFYTFNIPDPNTFAGMNGFYDNFINVQATNLGDATSTLWSVQPLAQNFSWTLTNSNFSLSYSLTSPNIYTGNLQSVSGLTDTMEPSYNFPLATTPGQSFITQAYQYGQYVVNFSGGGNNGLNFGNPYFLTLSIPGDWSTQGTAQGDHNFITLNSNWTITQNFTFAGGVTTFAAQELNYQGDNPGLQFQLIGAPAPEPSSMLLLGTGLIALLGAARQRLQR